MQLGAIKKPDEPKPIGLKNMIKDSLERQHNLIPHKTGDVIIVV
jgi:hypothetical protein